MRFQTLARVAEEALRVSSLALAVSLFGEGMRLRPLSEECKRRWRAEMDIMLSVCEHIVELVPQWHNLPDGTQQEVGTL